MTVSRRLLKASPAASLLALCLAVAGAVQSPAAEAGPQSAAFVAWTAIIPDGFPRNIYSWRLKPDGSYEEDGRSALTGSPIQETLFGRWAVQGSRMVLRQTGIRFVFDGTVSGNTYTGALYLDGEWFSRFCAEKGEEVPRHCDEPVS